MLLKKIAFPQAGIILAVVLISMTTFNFSSCRPIRSQPTSADIREIWFDDIKGPVSFSRSEWEQLVSFVISSILLEEKTETCLPATISHDNQPRIVFISMGDSKSHCHVVMGSGLGVVRAFKQAVFKAHILLETAFKAQWIKVDIVQETFSFEEVDFNQPLQLARSLYGMAFDRSTSAAFIPEELVAHTLVNKRQHIRRDKIVQYLERYSANSNDYKKLFELYHSKMYRFSTKAFFSDGKDIVNLYRGHRFYDKISGDELLSAAVRAGQYLTRSAGPDGKFVYIYRAKTDKVAKKYNIIRHSGTVYSMLELYEVTGDEELLKAAERAVRYLLKWVYPCQTKKGTAACIVEEGYVKLGGNALSAVALAKSVL